jgi:hypothetical protein
MANKQATPETVLSIRVSQIKCDLQAGPSRRIARLAAGGPVKSIKAIWRNEVGRAAFTPPRTQTP